MPLSPEEPSLILASQSPRRISLLQEAGYDFEVRPAKVDEIEDPHLCPIELTRCNAQLKARKIGPHHSKSLILGADTTVCRDGKTYGKPESINQAKQYLTELQGGSHEVVTAVCLLQNERETLFHEITKVHFHALNSKAIDDYLGKINPLDKAGAYGIQDHGEMIVQRIEGSWSNVVGLPMETLVPKLTASLEKE